MVLLTLKVCFLCLIAYKANSEEKSSPTAKLTEHAKVLAHNHHDPLRSERMGRIFAQTAGVYRNKTKVTNSRLKSTVMINLVEGSGHRWNSNNHDKYKQLLQNHLCFTSLYDLEPVVFLSDDNSTRFLSEAKELQKINPNVRIVDYPHELFWNEISKKTTPIHESSFTADYKGDTPSFKHFGFLVMLIPMLEVLEAGYNVMFFDVDIALVRDPIPFMIQGTADVLVSIEKRNCVYPSLYENRDATDWREVEPNTGTLFAQSNPQTIALFRGWIHQMIQENTINDQKLLDLKVALNTQQSFDCNEFAEHVYTDKYRRGSSWARRGLSVDGADVTNNDHKGIDQEKSNDTLRSRNWSRKLTTMAAINTGRISHNQRGSNIQGVASSSALRLKPVTFCFLNELLFQNGKLAFSCAFDRHGSKAEYMIALASMRNATGSVPPNYSPPPDTLSQLPLLYREAKENSESFSVYPVTVHANYCDNKKGMLAHLGLWIAGGSDETNLCHAYHLNQTFFGKLDWAGELFKINSELNNIQGIKNNTVLKISSKPTIYLYLEPGVLRPFGSGEQFINMGYQWSDVKQIKTQYSFFMNFTIGPFIGS